MEQEINVIGTLNAAYSALRTIHVSGDTDVFTLGNVFRGLYAVIQKLSADQHDAEEAAAKAAEKAEAASDAAIPPHKRNAADG